MVIIRERSMSFGGGGYEVGLKFVGGGVRETEKICMNPYANKI